jgi:L-lactate dehydrogenase (cytochrome)
MSHTPGKLSDCYSIRDLRALARRHLPGPIFDYLEGGAEDELTLRRNTTAFDALQLMPRCLRDVAAINTATEILGQKIQLPLICAPTGASRLYHPEGELAVARGASRAGTYYSLSIASTHSLEAIAAVGTGPKLFQILVCKDRGLTRELVQRAKALGYQALCITVDAALRGKREREARSGLPARPTLATKVRMLRQPGWYLEQVRAGPFAMPHLSDCRYQRGAGQSGGELASRNRGGRLPRLWSEFIRNARFLSEQLDPAVIWDDIQQIVEIWNGPCAIKGIMSAEDARRAADIGATAIVVSNHGGRQFDGAPAPIEVLPGIVATVGHRVEVILDGGIRRGRHVLIALALGAKACAVGRPYLYGLSAQGEAGVFRALELLREELVAAMRFCGCTDVRDTGRSLLRPA